MMRSNNGIGRSNPYSRYSYSSPHGSHIPGIPHASKSKIAKVMIIQRYVRKYIIDVKKAAANATCPFSMEVVILRNSVRIIDGSSVYLLSARLLAEYFMKNYKLINPFTFRTLTDMEFRRICKHPVNKYIQPALEKNWQDRELLLAKLEQKRSLMNALTDDLETVVDDALRMAMSMCIHDALNYILDTFPLEIIQVVNDFLTCDEDELFSVLRNIINNLKHSTNYPTAYVHLVCRHLGMVLSDLQ